MSYLFDANNRKMIGTFDSAYSDEDFTIACWVKTSDSVWFSTSSIIQLGNSQQSGTPATADRYDSIELGCTATDGQFRAVVYNNSGTISTAGTASLASGTANSWTPVVVVFQGASSRQCYATASETTDGVQTNTTAVADSLKYIHIGERLDGLLDFNNGYLAEVAMWNVALSAGQITSYLTATDPSTIASANLVGYWPLNVNASTQSNLGVDTGGDLAVTSATYSSDHPVIGSTKRIVPVNFIRSQQSFLSGS